MNIYIIITFLILILISSGIGLAFYLNSFNKVDQVDEVDEVDEVGEVDEVTIKPIDCETEPGEWGECIDGSKTRPLNVTVQPFGGGQACPFPLEETVDCSVLTMTLKAKENTKINLFAIYNDNTKSALKKGLDVTTTFKTHKFEVDNLKEVVITLTEWNKGVNVSNVTYNQKSIYNNYRFIGSENKKTNLFTRDIYREEPNKLYRFGPQEAVANHYNAYIFSV